MNEQPLLVKEIFHSLQGESSLSGLRFAFIRLSGCNLRCSYCDSSYTFKGGTRMSIRGILEAVRPYDVNHVLITGGEPLLQRPVPHLLKELKDAGYEVSIETHGEISIEFVTEQARIIMDIKTPSSGMNRMNFFKNFKWLKPSDEIKFVIASEQDYDWAKELLNQHEFPTPEILFSPAVWAPEMPGSFPGVSLDWLSGKILEDHLPVRFQTQLHKQIWGPEKQGV